MRNNFPHLDDATKRQVIEDLRRHDSKVHGNIQVRGPLDAIGDLAMDHWIAQDVVMMHDNGAVTPASYAKGMISIMDATKELLEFFAAQDNMDLFKGKPLIKQMYSRVISTGMQSLFGRINR